MQRLALGRPASCTSSGQPSLSSSPRPSHFRSAGCLFEGVAFAPEGPGQGLMPSQAWGQGRLGSRPSSAHSTCVITASDAVFLTPVIIHIISAPPPLDLAPPQGVAQVTITGLCLPHRHPLGPPVSICPEPVSPCFRKVPRCHFPLSSCTPSRAVALTRQLSPGHRHTGVRAAVVTSSFPKRCRTLGCSCSSSAKKKQKTGAHLICYSLHTICSSLHVQTPQPVLKTVSFV